MLLAEVVVSHALRSPIPGSEPPSQAGAPHTCWLHKPLRGPTPVSGLSLSLPTPGPIPLASLLSHSQAAGATQHPTSPTSQARPASSEGRGSGGACLWPRPPGGGTSDPAHWRVLSPVPDLGAPGLDQSDPDSTGRRLSPFGDWESQVCSLWTSLPGDKPCRAAEASLWYPGRI